MRFETDGHNRGVLMSAVNEIDLPEFNKSKQT